MAPNSIREASAGSGEVAPATGLPSAKAETGAAILRPGRSLTRRLIWLASTWILLALVATGWALTIQYRESAYGRLGDINADTIDEVVVATQVENGQPSVRGLIDARTRRLLSGKYWIVAEPSTDGRLRLLQGSESLAGQTLEAAPRLTQMLTAAPGETISYNSVGPRGEPIRVAASLKSLPGRSQPLVYMAAIDRSAVEADTREFATLTWMALVALGVVLVGAVFLQVRIGLQPLFGLRNEIANVRKGQAARIERTYPSEIQPLAEQVNRLLDQNQETVERQRTHVGNLAHALKTPLSVMLAEAEGKSGDLPELVRRQADIMRAQVEHHLRRARAAARAQMLGERTPVEEVVDELAVMLERVFATKGVLIDWEVSDGLTFRGERQDLQEILGNLMENACKWCRREVRILAGPTGLGQMVLVVEDDGQGLPEDQRQAVLKRGERLDESAPGSGLGLAIVNDLTRAYDGRLTLGASDLGGLKVMLELPATEA